MRKLFSFSGVIMLMLFASGAWSATAGFESSNPDTVMQFIEGNSVFVYLSAFFGVGILLAFTPCVLPMVPILSGIIVGQNSLSTAKAFKLSLSYVMGMAFTYAVAGMLAGYMGSTVQTLMQRPAVIGLFSVLFIIMAFSMFGFFELKLPQGLSNKLNGVSRGSNRRNYVSVGLMGVLSTLVVSPCVTAPLIGVLGYIGQNGQVLMGGVILFVMALGMGLPLLIVGSGYGSILPKTGPWMIKIKQLFGFFMLGIALWMMSRLVDAMIINVLWAVLLIVGSISMGSLKSQKNKIGVVFQSIGILALIFGGIILHSSIFPNHLAIHHSTSKSPFVEVNTLKAVQDYLEQGKKTNKVVFLDFSAGWCGDCQDMDSKVFNQPNIVKAMEGLISIKVDISDKTPEVARIKKAFAIYGTPTMLFFDNKGTLVHELVTVGFVSQDTMLDLLHKVKQLG